ncbi:hypothetical protein ACVBEQ_05245 [Nakamurella sp. GG22]
MADFRVFDQVDQGLGKIAINLDHVIRIERHEEKGMKREGVTLDLSAFVVLTPGNFKVQVPIISVYENEAQGDELDTAFEEFIEKLTPRSPARRS